ncbi:MAG TPA: ATP-binding protein [Thermoanaerobaculia bacterium]|nr:ATP-binding protein [Thermoanaerobaculia bacterium]
MKAATYAHTLDGTLMHVSETLAAALGKQPQELIGTNLLDLLDTPSMFSFDRYIEELEGIGIATGKTGMMAADGTRRVWLFTSVITNDPLMIVRGSIRDITASEEEVSALRQTEEEFRAIVESASDVIAVLSHDGVIRYANGAFPRSLGHEVADLQGTTLISLVHPEDRRYAYDWFHRRVKDEPETGGLHARLRHRDGRWRSFEIVGNAMQESGSLVLHARDITQRLLLETQLEQANRLSSLGRLAATVAHEFNNVLMGIQPFADLLQRADASPITVAKCSQHISNSVRRGKQVALDILRFTQPAEPAIRSLSLSEWWDHCAPELEGLLGNHIRFVVDIPESLTILADSGQLAQVLTNLVSNARDAMPKGGTLTVKARRDATSAKNESFVHISVSDTGTGISPDIVRRIFDPLFTTKQNGGTGLGLAVAHQVARRHGGYLTVESELGKGSTFHLYLPMALDGTLTEPAADPAARETRFRTKRVIFVEDEKPIAEGVTRLLSDAGIEVHAVGTGSEGEAAVERMHPDLVILDIGLPDADGIDVGHRIRSAHPLLPLIFATGHGDPRIFASRFTDRRTKFLQKPFEIDMLLDTIIELEHGDVA